MAGEMWKNKSPFRLTLNRAASDKIARHCKHCTERGVAKLHESGTALAEGMRVPVSKMVELIAAHVKHVARQVQGRSFITTSCRESISQQKHSSSTRAASINPPSNQHDKRGRKKGDEVNGKKKGSP